MSKTASTGNWSASGTWTPSGVPASTDSVTIPNGVTVTVDDTSATCHDCDVLSGALLKHGIAANTKLTVRDLTVEVGGEYDIGTSASPIGSAYTAEVVFQDIAFDTSLTTSDPYQSGCSVLVLGKLRIYGSSKTAYARLSQAYSIGATSIVLASAVTGWAVGDQLLFTDGRQDLVNGTYHPELRTITSISGDGLTVGVSALTYAKPRAKHYDGTLDYCSHVLNLTRNVHLKSANASGTRGCLFMYNASDCDIRNASFLDMGRSRGDIVYDETTTDGSGNVTHVGTNQTNHFAVQYANLFGPATIPASGWQSVFQGNVVYDTSALFASVQMVGIGVLGWYVLVKNNVVVNKYGAGIVVPVGNSYNRLEANFVACISGTGNRGDGVGHDGFDGGSGYFVGNPVNSMTGNFAANINPGGTYSYGLTMQMPSASTTVTVPASQGADPSVGSTTINVNQVAITLLSNEEYYACPNGWTVWNLNSLGDGTFQGGPYSTVSNMTVWNVYGWGVFVYPCEGLTVDTLEIFGDSALITGGTGLGEGVKHADYPCKKFVLTNSTIENAVVGWTPPVNTGATDAKVSNSQFACGTGILVTFPWSVNADQSYFPTSNIVVDNCTFTLAAGNALVMQYPAYTDGIGWSGNLMTLRTVHVTKFQGVSTDNFYCFWTQQAGTYVVPITVTINGHVRLEGAPSAGQNNTYWWTNNAIAIGGAVAPAGSTTKTGIGGLTHT